LNKISSIAMPWVINRNRLKLIPSWRCLALSLPEMKSEHTDAKPAKNIGGGECARCGLSNLLYRRTFFLMRSSIS
jgi:hypothetical protein